MANHVDRHAPYCRAVERDASELRRLARQNRALSQLRHEADRMTISPVRRVVIRILVPVYLCTIAGIPLLITVWTISSASAALRPIVIGLAPAAFVAFYVLVAGTLARLTTNAIVPGKFARDLGHPVYGPRRLYALCWTAVFYSPAVYH